MDLTNSELDALHGVLYDAVHYGDDEIVYGDGEEAVNLRSALRKVEDEAKRRKFWWA